MGGRHRRVAELTGRPGRMALCPAMTRKRFVSVFRSCHGVRRPEWWCYPAACENGHEWGPGLITVSWVLCDCPAAQAACGGGAAGHMAVFCNAAPGCRSVWYRPRCELALAAV